MNRRDKVYAVVTYVENQVCDICNTRMRDVAKFGAGLFADGTICDSCCALVLRGYDSKVGGPTLR